MDRTDYDLLKELECGLPLVREPFSEIARRLGLTEREVLERLTVLQAAGVIRKFRARIDQRRVGFIANALVAWNLPAGCRHSASRFFVHYPGITHCYERQPIPGRWEYSFYTVHHGKSRKDVLAEVAEIARRVGIGDYLVLFSTEEFKRAPAVRLCEQETVAA